MFLDNRYYVYSKSEKKYLKYNGDFAEFGQDYVEEMRPLFIFLKLVKKEDAEKEIRQRESYYAGLNIGD